MRRALIAVALAAAGAGLGSGSARADSPARAIDVVVFRPTTGHGLLTVDAPRALEHLVLRFGAFFSAAKDPLIAGGSNRATYKVVSDLAVVDVSAAIGVGSRFELGVGLPIVVSRTGERGVGAAAPLEGADLGDVRIVPKVRLDGGGADGWGVSLMPILTLPTGAEDANAGEPGGTFAPQIALGFHDSGGAEVAVDLGYRMRYAVAFGRLLVDDQLTFAVGGRVPLVGVLGLLADVHGAIGVSENVDDPDAGVDASEMPVEADAALELAFDNGLALVAGAGAGLTQGWGAPAWRAFGGLSFTFDTKPPPDADGDGLADADDRCRNEPEDKDGFEDGDGCPDPDNDGDGVADADDRCPREAEDKDGFEDADGCPDPDNDGDGVLDAADRCPTEAEDKDGFQDGDGCLDPDNDGDGIVDAKDACPDKAETMNSFEDGDGCPDELPGVKLTDKGIEIEDAIYFVVARAEIDPQSDGLIDKIAKLILANPQVTKIRVEGHTDDLGPVAFNMDLSEKRADAVMAALVAHGVAADRLVAEGFGPTRPVCTKATPACRAKNRRTEFKLLEVNGKPVPE